MHILHEESAPCIFILGRNIDRQMGELAVVEVAEAHLLAAAGVASSVARSLPLNALIVTVLCVPARSRPCLARLLAQGVWVHHFSLCHCLCSLCSSHCAHMNTCQFYTNRIQAIYVELCSIASYMRACTYLNSTTPFVSNQMST